MPIITTPPYKKKLKITGNIVHLTEYEKYQFREYELYDEEKENVTGKKKDGDKRIDNVRASITNLRDIINSNMGKYDDKDMFITFTFAPSKNVGQDLTSVDYAKKCFNKFRDKINRRRLKEEKEKLRYVYVLEPQKSGNLHFHCIFFGLGYIRTGKQVGSWYLAWGLGSVHVEDIKTDNVGAYITKYILKELWRPEFKGKDLYGRSRNNLLEPIIIIDPQQIADIVEGLDKKRVYVYSFENEYTGLGIYSQFNVYREFDNNMEYSQNIYNDFKNKHKNRFDKKKTLCIDNE